MDISPTKQRAHRYIGTYLTVILFVFSFGLGILTGHTWPAKGKELSSLSLASESNQALQLGQFASDSSTIDFAQFWQVWNRIKEKYTDKEKIKDNDLFYGAMQGLVLSLNDPYSQYFPPAAAEEFNKGLSGELEGIGAEVGIKKDQLVIVSPLPSSPAEKAGLIPGDRILAIDKISTAGMDIGTAVGKIRGKATTPVVLTVQHPGASATTDVIVVRAHINVPAILFSMKPNNIAYVRVMNFNATTASDFSRAITQLKKKGARGLVLDLRNNPGGYLDSAVAMASEWLPEGEVIVSEKNTDGTLNNTHTSTGSHRLSGIKTIVLVNGGSASASEILAGALKDHGVATVIGEKTFGKGSVQDYEIFPDGSALKLTVAEWFTPNGKNINKEGIAPDVEVKQEWSKEEIGHDVMFDKAAQLLK